MPKKRLAVGEEFTRAAATVSVEDINEKERTAVLSITSEYPVMRWGEPEILCHDKGSVDLKRLRDIGVCLYNHGTEIGNVMGPIMKAWVDEESKKLKVKVRFDDDEDAEKVWQKVLKGTLKGTSFRGRADVVEYVQAGKTSTNGRFKGPCTVVTRWEPIEATITPIPADPSVGVGRSIEEEAIDPLRLSRQRDLVLINL